MKQSVNAGQSLRSDSEPILTEPENIGRGVPGLEPWCMFLELLPLGRGKGVWGLDIVS